MQRLSSQNQRFHGLIGKLGYDADEKKAIVREASAGRVSSSKDMTAHEMQKAIDMLTGNYDSRIAKMQAKARAIASDIGLIKGSDYTALNTFIANKFKVSNLFQLDYNKLRHCITALERWRDGLTNKMVKELVKQGFTEM